MGGPRDEFLSEEDLDLQNLTDEELSAWWMQWLLMAQATNDLDYPAINGVALFAGFAFLIGNLVTDMLYAYADPKIRLA